MANELETLCYISEQTSFEEDYRDNFGYKIFDRGNRFYIIFDAILQSFGVRNRNGRKYNCDNIWNCIQTDEMIQTFLKNNSWIGEENHPEPKIQGQELTLQRIGTPDMSRSSHYIRKPRLNGNFLEATIQTDSGTEHGMNMAIKIVDGKIIPCFSARVLGALSNNSGDPVVNVRKLITYDWVLYPSHREAQAKIQQPVMESVKPIEEFVGTIIFLPELARMAAANSKETAWLCESFGLSDEDIAGFTPTGNSIVLTEGSNVYVQPISDKNIRAKTRSIVTDWLNS